jgi:site-specific DNA-methyltransferase (adenine-specific)
MSSKEGDTILDCFSGTSTTGEAAMILGRKFIGYETSPAYIKASEVRLSPYMKDGLLLAA